MTENHKHQGSSNSESKASTTDADSRDSLGASFEDAPDQELAVILRDWSAREFADIYVRYRPHLLTHAKKFLRDETQAEEVVQDVFLYLMTALPELDSDLGVLKFLKWKTKMLCLDVIRSSHSRLHDNLVPLPDEIPDGTSVTESLERADDAAIIRMALAKLSPRHRDSLIMTMYEEKSHRELAAEMGIEENAARQLVHRARASFRKALVGEAELEGKTVSQILALAAKRASLKSAGISAAVVTILGSLVLLPRVSDAEPDTVLTSGRLESNPNLSQPYSSEAWDLDIRGDIGSLDPSLEVVVPDNLLSETAVEVGPELGDSEMSTGVQQNTATLPPSQAAFNTVLLDSEVDATMDRWGVTALESFTVQLEDGNLFRLDIAEDLTIHAEWESHEGAPHISRIWTTMKTPAGDTLVAAPKIYFQELTKTADGEKVFIAATDFLVGDLSGKFQSQVTDSSGFFRAALLLSADFSHQEGSGDQVLTSSQANLVFPEGS